MPVGPMLGLINNLRRIFGKNKLYQHSSTFRRRIRVRMGDKPFSCTPCLKSFSLLMIWKHIQEVIQGRNHLVVHCVSSPLMIHHLLGDTQRFMQDRNLKVVHYVKRPLGLHRRSGSTRKFTQGRKHPADIFLKLFTLRSSEVLKNSYTGETIYLYRG